MQKFFDLFMNEPWLYSFSSSDDIGFCFVITCLKPGLSYRVTEQDIMNFFDIIFRQNFFRRINNKIDRPEMMNGFNNIIHGNIKFRIHGFRFKI